MRRGISLSDLCFTGIAGDRLGLGAEQGKHEINEANATIQVTDDGGSNQGGSSGVGEKLSYSGCIVNVESMGFSNLIEVKLF